MPFFWCIKKKNAHQNLLKRLFFKAQNFAKIRSRKNQQSLIIKGSGSHKSFFQKSEKALAGMIAAVYNETSLNNTKGVSFMNKVSVAVVFLCAVVVMVFGSEDRNEHHEIRTVRENRVPRH